MQANGIKNFRFSIAWSRIYPTGTGQVTCNCPFHAVQITLAYQLGIVAAMMGKPSAIRDDLLCLAEVMFLSCPSRLSCISEPALASTLSYLAFIHHMSLRGLA